MVQWSEMKLDWLRRHLPFANGIPSHDTFGRVFSLLDAKQFEACFMRWAGVLCPSLVGQHVAIDGKLWFDSAVSGKSDRPFWEDVQTEKDHGRLETRRCIVTNDVDWLIEQNQRWVGLRSLIMVQSTRELIRTAKVSVEPPLLPQQFAGQGGVAEPACTCPLGYRKQHALGAGRRLSAKMTAGYATVTPHRTSPYCGGSPSTC